MGQIYKQFTRSIIMVIFLFKFKIFHSKLEKYPAVYYSKSILLLLVLLTIKSCRILTFNAKHRCGYICLVSCQAGKSKGGRGERETDRQSERESRPSCSTHVQCQIWVAKKLLIFVTNSLFIYQPWTKFTSWKSSSYHLMEILRTIIMMLLLCFWWHLGQKFESIDYDEKDLIIE